MVDLQNSDSDSDGDVPARPELTAQTGLSASVVPAMVRDDGLDGDRSTVGDRPRSALASWMSAITTRLDMLWNSFHGSPMAVRVSSTPELTEVDDGRVVTRQPLSAEKPRQYSKLDMTVSFDKQVTGGAPLEDRRAAPELSTDPQRRMSDWPVVRPPEKRIWHLDSDT